VQRLFERIEDEPCMRRPGDPPADNAAGECIDDEGHIDEPGPGRDIGEVADPEPVRRGRLELAVHPVERARRGLVGDRRADRLAPDDALQAHGIHQPLHRAARHAEPFAQQLTPDLPRAVDLEVLIEHPQDMRLQGFVTPDARRRSFRAPPPRVMRVICGRGDLQNPADRLDPVLPTMIVDEGDHVLNRRSSSA